METQQHELVPQASTTHRDFATTVQDSQEAHEVASVHVSALRREYLQSFRVWLALYKEADCLTNLEKRLAMIQARRLYQEAKLNYFYSQRLPAE